jgi:hypothetical protein
MTLIRFAPIALAASLLTGCGSAPEDYIEPESPPAAEGDSTSMAELLDQNVRTGDPGVSRLKDPAKTIGYAPGSTEIGEKLLDDALIVDQITRQDADNHFGVTVCLFNNRDDAAAVFEWRIVFFNAQGAEVKSLNDWKSKALDAKRWGTISNSAAVRGAVTFKVEARVPVSEPAPTPEEPGS